MKKDDVNLFYGALLHDIGKVVQRASGQREKHAIVGADWFENLYNNEEVAEQIRYHMASYLPDLPSDNLAYITYIADNIASGVDRRESCEEVEGQPAKIWDTYTNQEDIFNLFGPKYSKRYFKPRMLNVKEDPNWASSDNQKFSKGDYAGILSRIEATLSSMELSENYMSSLLNLLEATLSFVPASTNTREIADISLYEHSKLTAAFAMAIRRYLLSQDRDDFKTELREKTRTFYQEKAFLLVSFDVSGIQDFIYNIVSSGALKQLKARSLYLDFMSEHIADSLLERLELTRASLVYNGGGHAYFILPNTPEVKDILITFEKEFNLFLLKQFQTRLYLAFGWSEFAAQDIMSDYNSPSTYRKIYQTASRQISKKKVSRYDWKTLLTLNRGGKRSGRECVICHAVDDLHEVRGKNLCQVCMKLDDFAKKIRGQHFLISVDESGLPIGPQAYLSSITSEQIKSSAIEGRIYSKNDFFSGHDLSTHIFIGDYSYQQTGIDQYAKLSAIEQRNGEKVGIKRMGVVRLDVDDLGAGFMAGFTYQGEGRYNSLSRSATFSRSMSQFFKVYINQFAQDLKLTIIYSGGDDVFALGTWQDIIAFTVRLREKFIQWSQGKLTLSAGIGLFSDKTPVSIMAREAGELEEVAKESGKDSVALFSKDYVFKFNDFINEVCGEKLHIIRSYFNSQEERGKAFIYRLLSLLQSQDRMNIARLAYLLARLEDMTDSQYKEDFRTFKTHFFNWAKSDDLVIKKQAELALVLYIYETRKDK